MVKLSKCNKLIKKFGKTFIVSGGIVLALIGLASTIHHFLTILCVLYLLGIAIYYYWRLNKWEA
jgi:Flp pilus assembly protein TadB